MKILIQSLFLTMIGSVVLQAQSPNEVFVTTTGTGPGYPGWENATNDIQTGIDIVAAGGTVWISNGVYTLSSPINVADGITVKGLYGTHIPGFETIVDGGGSVRCFDVSGGAILDGLMISNGLDTAVAAVSLNNATMQNSVIAWNTGSHPNEGYIISASGAEAKVIDCQISNNIFPNALCPVSHSVLYLDNGAVAANCMIMENTGARGVWMNNNSRILHSTISGHEDFMNFGAGIYLTAGGLIDNCVIESNSVAENARCDSGSSHIYGAGVYMGRHDAGGTIANSIVRGNEMKASPGVAYGYGGIGLGIRFGSAAANEGDYVISNSWILNNKITGSGPSGSGGGIGAAQVRSLTVTHSVISGNVSTVHGGAIYIYEAVTVDEVLIRNCLIVDNQAGNRGAGIIVNQPMKIESCTIVNNRNNATPNDGGIHVIAAAPPENQTVINTVIYGNHPEDLYHHNGNIVYTNCCTSKTNNIAGNDPNMHGTGNIAADPLFVGDGDYRLQVVSPCIKAGLNQPDWMEGAVDLDGHTRIDRFSGMVDIGCYEYLHRGTLYLLR